MCLKKPHNKQQTNTKNFAGASGWPACELPPSSLSGGRILNARVLQELLREEHRLAVVLQSDKLFTGQALLKLIFFRLDGYCFPPP